MYCILASILILANIDPQDFPPRDQTKNCNGNYLITAVVVT